jgi:short-subunit dehydrogenase
MPASVWRAGSWRRARRTGDDIIGVNVRGVISGSRAFGALLVERGEGGTIINVASAAAYLPSKSIVAYSTTKAAVLGFSESLRADLADEGITCQQGFCGTCKVKVLAGQVDHRGHTAVAEDEMVVCVSRAKGDRVVIDA